MQERVRQNYKEIKSFNIFIDGFLIQIIARDVLKKSMKLVLFHLFQRLNQQIIFGGEGGEGGWGCCKGKRNEI